MAVLEPYEKTALRKAQRSWIAYRDLECEAEATLYNGGSGKGLIRQSCLYSITIDRLASLDRGFGWKVEKFSDLMQANKSSPNTYINFQGPN